jgi:hypothetical protein
MALRQQITDSNVGCTVLPFTLTQRNADVALWIIIALQRHLVLALQRALRNTGAHEYWSAAVQDLPPHTWAIQQLPGLLKRQR